MASASRPASLHPSLPLVTVPGREDNDVFAQILRQRFATDRPYFNEIITFNVSTKPCSWQIDQWAQPARLTSLLAQYGDHIYRQYPDVPRQDKPLKSLWAQWYIGLLVPPLIMALLTHQHAISLSPGAIQAEFHSTGRAAHFWLDAQVDAQLSQQGDIGRLEAIWREVVTPVVQALERDGEKNGRLIWSNTGYLVNWFLTELRPQIGDERFNALRQACFFSATLSSGEDNPLYRSVILRDGLLVRRTCCQRNRLPGVQQCGDCTLKR